MNKNQKNSYDVIQTKDTILDEIYVNQALYERSIMFVNEFDRETCYKAIYFLERIERQDDADGIDMKNRKPITIQINSYGGTVYDCYALISVIERMKDRGYVINTHVMGVAMSCGFLLAIVGTHRTIARHGYMMCHQILGGTYGELQKQEEDIDHTKELWEETVNIITKYTSITVQQLTNIKKSKIDYYMNATKSKVFKCVDEIL